MDVYVGTCRRGVWQMAGKSLARPRTSACWRSSARGCAPFAPGCNAGRLSARYSRLHMSTCSAQCAPSLWQSCVAHAVLHMHYQRECQRVCGMLACTVMQLCKIVALLDRTDRGWLARSATSSTRWAGWMRRCSAWSPRCAMRTARARPATRGRTTGGKSWCVFLR